MSLIAIQRELRNWLQAADAEPPERFDARDAGGLRVYRNNYRAQLVGCLEQSFPHSRAWIGESAFFESCVAHIDSVPPTSWTIDDYAAGFPATLGALYPNDPEVAELAWLEFALGEALVSGDAASLTPAELGEVDWDSVRLSLAPSRAIRATVSNAAAIWSALVNDAVPPPAKRLTEPAALLVWRCGFEARFRTIDIAEMDALNAIAAGMPFGELCAGLVASEGETEGVRRASEWLSQWIADGLICGFSNGPIA